MKKIIFLIVLIILISYAWFDWRKLEINNFFKQQQDKADNYIQEVQEKSDLIKNSFDQASDKYLDKVVANLNNQVKNKIKEWLENNKNASTTTASLSKPEDYKKILQDNPQLLDYLIKANLIK
jgi:uncharacterized protein YxeA